MTTSQINISLPAEVLPAAKQLQDRHALSKFVASCLREYQQKPWEFQ